MQGNRGSPGYKNIRDTVSNCHSPNAVSHTRTWRASTCRGVHRECYSEVGGWVGKWRGGETCLFEENQQQFCKHLSEQER